MRWFPWRRRATDSINEPLLDVPALLDRVRADRRLHRTAYDALRTYRTTLLRRKKVLERQLRRPTTSSVRQAGRLGPQLGSMQLTQDMRAAGLDRGLCEQETELERQIAEVDRALNDLRSGLS